jgi:two-component system, OmpR family, phosphate regulon response regulator PhoB
MLAHLAPTIMVIEPDVIIRTSASNALERSSFNTITAANSDEALRILKDIPEYKKPHIFVISAKLEGLSGIELCTILKVKQNLKAIPIIMTAHEEDSIQSAKGLENSFDDYLLKPFAQSDLVLKVKTWLSKARPQLKSKLLSFKNIQMNLSSYKVSKNGIEIHLGPTEFKILQCLVENPTQIFSREDIMHYVWQSKDNVEVRTIDVHINRLRTALRQPHEHITAIKTVRAAGYCLEIPGS